MQDGAIMAVETLAGKEIAHYIANLNEGIRDVSPCERVFISQSLLEPLLEQRAEELGADLRFATEIISVRRRTTPASPRTLRHRDSGETSTRARRVHGRRRWRAQPRPRASSASRMQRPRRFLQQHHDLLPRRRHGRCCAAAISA